LALYDATFISLYRVTENLKIEAVLLRFNTLFERLSTGVFFTMPHQKAHLYANPYLFVYAGEIKGKLGYNIGSLETDGEL
jgi:hypothetical protein